MSKNAALHEVSISFLRVNSGAAKPKRVITDALISEAGNAVTEQYITRNAATIPNLKYLFSLLITK